MLGSMLKCQMSNVKCSLAKTSLSQAHSASEAVVCCATQCLSCGCKGLVSSASRYAEAARCFCEGTKCRARFGPPHAAVAFVIRSALSLKRRQTVTPAIMSRSHEGRTAARKHGSRIPGCCEQANNTCAMHSLRGSLTSIINAIANVWSTTHTTVMCARQPQPHVTIRLGCAQQRHARMRAHWHACAVLFSVNTSSTPQAPRRPACA